MRGPGAADAGDLVPPSQERTRLAREGAGQHCEWFRWQQPGWPRGGGQPREGGTRDRRPKSSTGWAL